MYVHTVGCPIHSSHYLFKFFLRATERISTKGSPLLYDVIPLIDKLSLQLEKAVKDRALSKVVRVAAARGLGVLNKYYSKTDDSIMYRLAMSKSVHLNVGWMIVANTELESHSSSTPEIQDWVLPSARVAGGVDLGRQAAPP